MAKDDDDNDTVVLITTFVVPTAMESLFLNWWRLLRFTLGAQPGFISARLYRSLDNRERYRFVNVAQWTSNEAQREAMTRLWSSVPKPPVPGLEWHPALYEMIEET